jgi:hypothetical protein
MVRKGLGWFASLFAAFLVVGAFIPATRGRQDRVAVLTGVLVVAALTRNALGVGHRAHPPAPLPPDDLGIADEQDVRLARLDASVARAAESGEHYAKAFAPMLRRLVTRRIADRAGIDVTADPAGARRLMGEELWEIFATSPDERAPAPDPQRLRVLVERLERL